jgi:hypothetical protein
VPVEDGLIKEIRRKIQSLPENDPDRLQLILLEAIHEDVTDIKKNPAFKLGKFAKEYPAVATIIFAVFLSLLVLLPDVVLKLFGVTLPIIAP